MPQQLQAAQDQVDLLQAQVAQQQQELQAAHAAPAAELSARLTATQELLRAARVESEALYQRQDDLLGLAATTVPAARVDVRRLSIERAEAVARHEKLTREFDGVLGRVEVGDSAWPVHALHLHPCLRSCSKLPSATNNRPRLFCCAGPGG